MLRTEHVRARRVGVTSVCGRQNASVSVQAVEIS